MKKWFKKTAAMVLTAAMAMSVGVPAFAAEHNIEAEGKLLSETVFLLPQENQQKPITGVVTRAGDVEYKREVAETKTFYKKYIGPAGNQLPGGYVFTSPGGGFYWSDGGNTVAVSFGLTAGPVTLNIATGKTGGTGQIIGGAPVNVACKLHVYKDVTVTKYALYKRPVGSSKWTLDSYQYGSKDDKAYLEIRTV